MAESSSGRPEELFSETMTDLTDFDGFPSDSPVIGRPARTKKPRLLAKPTHPIETSSTNSPQSTPQADKPTQVTCLLLREDKKSLPFNFFAQTCKNWPALQLIEPESLHRNAKGTLITGKVPAANVNRFINSEHTHEHNGIKYTIRIPKTPPLYQGEVVFDLTDMEDKSILSYSTEDLIAQLMLPSSKNSNKITSIKKLYPSHAVADPNNSQFLSMRIAIECSSAVPDKVFFHNVALNVHSYLAPPPRCYGCQRFGHGAISCRRRSVCARCSSPNHVVQNCDADNPCCASCKGAHPASSPRCPFYKKALAISSRVAARELTREMAAKEYAALYMPTNIIPSQQAKTNENTPASLPKATPSTAAPSHAYAAAAARPSYASSVLTPGQRC
jgi:hypothetical protein